MVDSVEQLDLIDAVTPPAGPAATLRVCLDLDASWRPLGGRAHIGVRRSPLHAPGRRRRRWPPDRRSRPGFRLVGVMSYEAQIAGLGDAPPGRPLLRPDAAHRSSAARCGDCWTVAAAAVAAARQHADLEFVNGGGTGSVAATAADPAVTELTAGSGLYGPTLFDAYRAWRPTPAAYFALSVVRRPGRAWPPCTAAAGSPPARPSTSRLPRPGAAGAACACWHRGRRRGADPAGRAGGGRTCASATGSGSATPRPASCASTWTRCTWSAATTIERAVPTYRGDHAPRSCDPDARSVRA